MGITFLLATLVVVVTPGTGVLYTLSAALSHGRRAGLVAALGCTLGTVPHLVAAMAGLAVLLGAGGPAFRVVQVLGLGYLLYLAWRTWRERGGLALDAAAPARPAGRVILDAVLVNLLNPKPTLFLAAFLPQFVAADAPGAAGRMLTAGAVFMLLTLVVFAGYAVAAARLRGRLLERPRTATWLRRGFAASFLPLGVALALTNG
ncbi:LysE family translocator [Micromonospora sp. PLK6-60]|uniref:LysE family translocator n=1 Tax=Micromonospora sp. PLK6-60 TaxID=2873383 RepID=UPI001CA642F3|nr:LysE family translocator [Micromonospora sp. PLK6-60]MBY8874932.1 LysE family translocator [Micromonospora sp. PLK6-60]